MQHQCATYGCFDGSEFGMDERFPDEMDLLSGGPSFIGQNKEQIENPLDRVLQDQTMRCVGQII